MAKDNRILIIGSVAIDSIETPFGKKDDILGGSATFSSISASFFNKTVGIVAVIGKDFPPEYINVLKKRGVNLKGLEVKDDGLTFRWKGDYLKDMESPETLYTHLNVFADFKPKIPKEHKSSPYLFLANIDPDLQDAVLKEMSKPKLVVCDTMNYWIQSKPDSLKRLLKNVDIFLINEQEARQLSNENNLIKAAKYIMDLGAKSVVVKKGEHGVLYFSENMLFSAPAFLVESVVDPTGAGDTFAGGMLGYLSSCGEIDSRSIKKSLVYGSIMASFAVSDFSVGGLTRVKSSGIAKRFKEFVKLTRY